MVSFFRSYDPIRLLAIFLLLLLIRLPFLLTSTAIPNLQVDLMNVGERLANGFIMYHETWDTLEPLSAGFFWLVNMCFGKSFVVLQLLSILIIYFHAIYISIIFNINNVYGDRTMLPGLIYVILASCFIDYFYITPLLLGMTFLLPVFHWMFRNLKINTNEELFYVSGIFIGIAALFQFYLGLFVVWFLIYLLVFIKPTLRVYFVVLIGFLLPFLLTWLYYYIMGVANPLSQYLHIVSVGMVKESMMSTRSLLIVWIPSLLIFFIGIFYTLSINRYINYQYNIIKIMILYSIFGLLILILSQNLQPAFFILLLPSVAYFGANYFHHIKSFWLSELPLFLCFILCLTLCYGSINPQLSKVLKINMTNLLVKDVNKFAYLKGKRVLILGPDRAPYIYARPCTPYINWKFSKSVFQSKRDYEKIAELYLWIKKENPQYIIDQERLISVLFTSIPALRSEYEKVGFEEIYEWKGSDLHSK